MQLSEFKAWFEGYTESMKGTPTEKQWARIKERIAEIDGKPVTERVFVDRYWPSYQPWYFRDLQYYPPTRSTLIVGTSGGVGAANHPQYTFNSITCMNTLGKLEASVAA